MTHKAAPVHCRVGYPDRGARGGRHGQAPPQARRDVPGPCGAAELDPRRGDLRAQLIGERGSSDCPVTANVPLCQ